MESIYKIYVDANAIQKDGRREAWVLQGKRNHYACGFSCAHCIGETNHTVFTLYC